MSVISVYAPTYNSPQEQKDKFYYDLQQAADSVPDDHLLLVLGDFNVRVGSSYILITREISMGRYKGKPRSWEDE